MVKLRHKQWRDRAHAYILEHGPQLARTLVCNIVSKRGLPLTHAPEPAEASALLNLDRRFKPVAYNNNNAVEWKVVE